MKVADKILHRRTSYIGVTGFTTNDQVVSAKTAVSGKLRERLLMVGVLVSKSTVEGKEGKFPARYPKAEDIAGIFLDDAQCLNIVHYATGDKATLLDQLKAVTNIAGPHLNGFQLNTAWPPAEVLKAYKEEHPDKVFIFAVSKRVFDSVDNDPATLAQRLHDTYGDLLDYILLDPSGGMGQPFDAVTANGYIAELIKKYEPWQIGAAGGLGPDTLDLVKPVIEVYPETNIDAEGKVRTKPEDELSIEAMVAYLEKAADIL